MYCEHCGCDGGGCIVCGLGSPRAILERTAGQMPSNSRDNRVERVTCAECGREVTGWQRVGWACVCWECEAKAAADALRETVEGGAM